jgi:hypothetical protein
MKIHPDMVDPMVDLALGGIRQLGASSAALS